MKPFRNSIRVWESPSLRVRKKREKSACALLTIGAIYGFAEAPLFSKYADKTYLFEACSPLQARLTWYAPVQGDDQGREVTPFRIEPL